jgi:hypothetical protein
MSPDAESSCTGSSGQIGGAVVRRFDDLGWSVVQFDLAANRLTMPLPAAT